MALSNNDIFKKLRVAHKLRDDDIIKICLLVGFQVTKSELGAIFRKEGHEKYVECGDQFLRNFLNGLVIHLRGPMPERKTKPEVHDGSPTADRNSRPKKDYSVPDPKKVALHKTDSKKG